LKVFFHSKLFIDDEENPSALRSRQKLLRFCKTNFKQWHIAKHDVYGNDCIQAWENSGDVEICPADMEAISQEDELEYE
jgi:hypothetical protein